MAELLRCPRCGLRVQIDEVVSCENGHEYPVRLGVPRLVESAWQDHAASELQIATSEAFGDQWNELGESAGVTLADRSTTKSTGAARPAAQVGWARATIKKARRFCLARASAAS